MSSVRKEMKFMKWHLIFFQVQSETDVQKLKAMQEKIDESRKKTKELEEQLSTQKVMFFCPMG